MASAAEAPATQQQYLAQVAITSALVETLRNLEQAAPSTSEAYSAGLHAITEHFAQISSSVARDYYQQVRVAAGITAPVTIKPIAPPPASLVNADLAWALRAQQEAMASVQASAEQAKAAIQRRIEASIQKAVTDSARDQVIQAVAGDEKAIGFRRVPRPDACSFCVLMAIRSTHREGIAADLPTGSNNNDRGISYGGPERFGVYKTRASASGANFVRDFEGDGTAKFHNHCHCVVEPVFSAVEALPPWLEDMRKLYADNQGLNGFRRALYAKRAGREPAAPIAPVVPITTTSAQEQLTALLGRLSDSMSGAA